MKVLLIAPSIRRSLYNGLSDGMPKKISENFGVYPHLGICYLASYLIDKGIGVEIIDTNTERADNAAISERIRIMKPDVIGITCMTFTFLDALNLARAIKKDHSIPVVFGGPHVTIYPEAVAGHDCVDFCVIGEGEKTLYQLIKAIEQTGKGKDIRSPEKIEGIVFKRSGKIVNNGVRDMIKDIDTIPPPAVGLLRGRYYGCNLPLPYMTMMTSRGCPYRCAFCSKVPWGSSYRSHSASRIVDEIEELICSRKVRSIDFFDDTFVIKKDRVKEVAEKVFRKSLHFEFGITTRVNNIDREILGLLKKMGCRTIAFGVEAGNDRILSGLNKKITVGQIKEAFSMTSEAGLNSVAFFLVGNPGEDKEDIQDTIELIKQTRPDYFIANILIPYPGSRLYDDMLRDGSLKVDYWKEVTVKGRAFPTPLANTTLSKEFLVKMRNRINRMPYLRSSSNLLKFNKLRSIYDLKRALNTLKTSLLGRNV